MIIIPATDFKGVNMNVYFERMKFLIDQKKLVSIFTDRFNESFIGYIRKVSDEFLLLEAFEMGQPDGIKIFHLCEITRIRWDSKELSIVNAQIKPNEKKGETNDVDISTIYTAITSIQKMYRYVTLYTQNLDTDICFIRKSGLIPRSSAATEITQCLQNLVQFHAAV
jgi:hypothetical protein